MKLLDNPTHESTDWVLQHIKAAILHGTDGSDDTVFWFLPHDMGAFIFGGDQRNYGTTPAPKDLGDLRSYFSPNAVIGDRAVLERLFPGDICFAIEGTGEELTRLLWPEGAA